MASVTTYTLLIGKPPPSCGVRIAIHGTNAELNFRACDTSSGLTTIQRFSDSAIQRKGAISLFYSFT